MYIYIYIHILYVILFVQVAEVFVDYLRLVPLRSYLLVVAVSSVSVCSISSARVVLVVVLVVLGRECCFYCTERGGCGKEGGRNILFLGCMFKCSMLHFRMSR